MSTTLEQIATCSTFVRLKHYYDVSLAELEQIQSHGATSTQQKQRAFDAKTRASEMLSGHELGCPVCRRNHS